MLDGGPRRRRRAQAAAQDPRISLVVAIAPFSDLRSSSSSAYPGTRRRRSSVGIPDRGRECGTRIDARPSRARADPLSGAARARFRGATPAEPFERIWPRSRAGSALRRGRPQHHDPLEAGTWIVDEAVGMRAAGAPHALRALAMPTILLLLVSNVFMTYAWYGHLKDLREPV
jgi:hypothetical protein